MSQRKHRSGPQRRTFAVGELGSLLQTLTRLAVASAAVACSGDELEGTSISCDQGGIARLSELEATRPLDYFELRRETGYSSEPRPTSWMPYASVRARFGEPCAGVADVARCQQELERLAPAPGCGRADCGFVAIVRSGETFERLEGDEAIRALVGRVESGSEAIALAMMANEVVNCPYDSGQESERATNVAEIDDGFLLRTQYEDCGDGVYRDGVHVSTGGVVTRVKHQKVGGSKCAVGRRPPGLVAAQSGAPAGTGAGAFLAEVARLEAASIHAFRALATELRALGAPSWLVAQAEASGVDEVRHARDMAQLARRYGGAPRAPTVRETPRRGVRALALDNAVEGCVRETFGALIATYQARTARDPEVRRVMRQIAEDETRHAQLSWQLAAWLETQLADDDKRAVERERAQAEAALWRELDPGLDQQACALLGIPTAAVSARLLRGLSETLWS